jgi:adenylate cyclase class 2
VESAAAGRPLLRAAGFRVSKRRVFEANALFDTPSGDLRMAGTLLRVRQVGAQGVLTYKGVSEPGKYKSREELETKVADPGRLCEILGRLNFVPGFRYEKYRTEYQRPRESGVATLDETPVGVYFELEGQPTWIDRTARRMGFAESAYIMASYHGLYIDYCRDRGVPPTNMTFEATPSSSRRAPSSESR